MLEEGKRVYAPFPLGQTGPHPYLISRTVPAESAFPATNIVQVKAELDSLGLDSATLAHLKSISERETSTTRRGSAFQYKFDGNPPCLLTSKLALLNPPRQ